MSIKATPISAFLFGFWTAFIMATSDALFGYFGVNEDIAQISFLIIGVIFFIVPGFFFVLGLENFRSTPWHGFESERIKAFPAMTLRLLCWFFGVVVFGFPYSELLKAGLR